MVLLVKFLGLDMKNKTSKKLYAGIHLIVFSILSLHIIGSVISWYTLAGHATDGMMFVLIALTMTGVVSGMVVFVYAVVEYFCDW